MDVRCEKCQTEYELDESRIKPGGVTVKCTHCGHLFKIREGGQAVAPSAPAVSQPEPPVPPQHADSMLAANSSIPAAERLWLIRLETGEQKTCRELATLQQWIAAGVVGRDAEISRSGKTWKRLGNIVELHPYFAVGDEARARFPEPVAPSGDRVSTLRGVASPSSEGGTYLPQGAEAKPEGPRPNPNPAHPLAQTELSVAPPQRSASISVPPPGTRDSATWTSGKFPESESIAAMPQGPRSGRLAMQDREPAFANRSRIEPGRMSSYDDDDDDDFLPRPRGSRAGMWLALVSLLAIAGAGIAVYMIKVRGSMDAGASAPQGESGAPATTDDGKGSAKDAATVAVPADAAPTTPADAQPAAPDPFANARADLLTGVEARLKAGYDALAGKTDAPSLVMRARLGTAIAQSQLDRADLTTAKAETEKLRKDARQLLFDSGAMTQRALQSTADDPNANIAMADVLRLQGKPASDVQRYLTLAKTPKNAAAKTTGTDEIARSIAMAEARLLMREAKFDDAQKLLASVANTGDSRVSFGLALISYARSKPADAKPLVAAILKATPDHDAALALQKRLETTVEKTDPLPPESAGSVNRGHGATTGTATGATSTATAGGTSQATAGTEGASYDSLVAKANKLAESNCTKAIEVYTKALEQNANGAEALTGMGYCFLSAKQYSSAFSKFRTALAVSGGRHEPALAGTAETYHQQGNKEQEAEAWRKYLEVYPNSQKAKKRLEALAPPADTAPPSAESPAPPAAPSPASPSEPSASPPPATTGSGSG